MLQEKIGVIGAGKIGSAIVRGVIRAGLANKENVKASDVSEALRQSIAQELGIKTTPDNGELCDFADIVILAVKPQIVDPVAGEIAKRLGRKKLLVSVAAGVPLGRLETHLEPGARVGMREQVGQALEELRVVRHHHRDGGGHRLLHIAGREGGAQPFLRSLRAQEEEAGR